MKVGTDGILLGVWASVAGPGSRVLDVGTGTGKVDEPGITGVLYYSREMP